MGVQALLNTDLAIFHPLCRQREKQDLSQRIEAFHQYLPQTWEQWLETLCHPTFRITVLDAAILQDFKIASLALTVPSPFTSDVKDRPFWQQLAYKIDKLIQDRAAFPLLSPLLPDEIFDSLLPFLPLPDLSHLIQASSFKDIQESPIQGPQKEPFHYTSRIKYLIQCCPRLILQAPSSSCKLKARACLQLSQEWKQSDRKALKKLFSIIHAPQYQLVRYLYLTNLSDPDLFQQFLKPKFFKSNSLDLIFPYANNPSALLQPHHLIAWETLFQSYRDIQTLNLEVQLDQSTLDLYRPILDIMATKLQTIQHVKLSSPDFFLPKSLNSLLVYRTIFANFKELHTLTIHAQKKASAQFIEPFKFIQYIHRQIENLASNIAVLLTGDSSLHTLLIEVDSLSELSQSCSQAIQNLYLIIYLNRLAPLITKAFSSDHFNEMQISLPKLNNSVFFLEQIDPAHLNETYTRLLIQKSMHISDNKLIFKFTKASHSFSSERG